MVKKSNNISNIILFTINIEFQLIISNTVKDIMYVCM